MPEGDTVWRHANRLRAALAGRPLTLVDLRWGTVSEAGLRGAVVQDVVPRGKHLLHRLDNGVTLHTHLRMEGTWRIEEPGSPEAARALRNPRLRAALGNDEHLTLGLRLGELDVVRTAEEGRLVGHLGPDILGPDWSDAEALARLSRDPREIAVALLDQRNLAGIGTLWASESLFLERLHPWTPVPDLPDGALPRLVDRARRLMLTGREHWAQSSTGSLRHGETHWVHARSGRPCRRCGTTIRVAPLGAPPQDRVFFSCPGCQGGPAPTDDGRLQAPLGAGRGRTDGGRRPRR